jgi:hypothetical protein
MKDEKKTRRAGGVSPRMGTELAWQMRFQKSRKQKNMEKNDGVSDETRMKKRGSRK